jgi:hypothetical protein
MQWILSYPSWTLALAALLSLGISFLLYQNAKGLENQPFWKRVFLATLRFSSCMMICLLLLEPLIKYFHTEKEAPLILVLDDNSASIKEAWNSSELSLHLQERAALHLELSKNFDTRYYQFGADVQSTEYNDSLSFREKATDITKAIERAIQEHTGKNIGAVIISTDGLFNTGISPLYSPVLEGVPIYSIALGDTTIKKDLLIRQVRYNDLVYLGDAFSLLVDVAAYRLDGSSAIFTLRNASGEVLKTEKLSIIGTEWSKSLAFELNASSTGTNKYTLALSAVSGEASTQNNIATIYINVIDGRQKILVLYDAPHPDIRLLKEVLEKNKNLESTVARWQDWRGTLPIYDLVIWHGLPSIRDRQRINELMVNTQQSKANWFITTTNSDLPSLNKIQDLINFEVGNKTPNEVTPRISPDFKKFNTSNEAALWLTETSPLVAPYGTHKVMEQAEVIWFQNIGKVATNIPLLVTGGGTKKTAVLAAEGLWRMAMQEQLRYNHQNITSEWIDRLVQFIAVKSDQRPFRLRSSKDLYREGESIALDAALLNESFQLVNDTDVSLEIKSEDGTSLNYIFDKTGNAYSINIGALAPGTYTALGKTNRGGKTYQASTKFSVREIFLESMQTTADHGLLRSLSISSGGKSVSHREQGLLTQMLKDDERIRPLLIEHRSTKSLLDFKWIFAVIIVLLTVEWFLRRFLGSY